MTLVDGRCSNCGADHVNKVYDTQPFCKYCEVHYLRVVADELRTQLTEARERAEKAEADAQTAKDGLESAARLLEKAEQENKRLRELIEKPCYGDHVGRSCCKDSAKQALKECQHEPVTDKEGNIWTHPTNPPMYECSKCGEKYVGVVWGARYVVVKSGN